MSFKKTTRGTLIPVCGDYPFQKIKLGEVRVGDIIASPIPQETFSTDVSESDARILGLYVANGWRSEFKKSSTVKIGFCFNASFTDLIEEVENKIKTFKEKEEKFNLG